MGITYGNDIGEAHERREDARCNDGSPHGQTEVLHAGSGLVEVTQDVEAQDHHGSAEKDEARLETEQGPALYEVGAEERELGHDEEEAHGAGDEVGDGIEEVEL
jgi:hypothetical protein